MILKDIRDKIGATPGLPSWEFGVRCYAVDMFEELFADRGLNPYSTLEELGAVTEKDLLNGSADWDAYSKAGNALIMCEDICTRLGDRKPTKEECKNCLTDQKDVLGMQGRALAEASKLILDTLAQAS